MRTLLLVFSLFLALNSNAQATGPVIKFTSQVVDYGEIERGSDGVRTFEFINAGNQPLIISKVYSSCGCTIPKKPEAPIAPGEKGEIQVKYDTNRVGPIRKTITVNSNAESTPIISLKIKGTVL
ncbi:MAG: DUF1573 domain-containing protein [Flavobacteriaceae bacterium]